MCLLLTSRVEANLFLAIPPYLAALAHIQYKAGVPMVTDKVSVDLLKSRANI